MEKVEKGKYIVREEKNLVGFGHTTKTADGKIDLTTWFDFSKVSRARLLYFAASACLIKWRASSGIKDLTTEEAKDLNFITVDCSKTVEKKKHVETEQEKRMKVLMQVIMSGKDMKDSTGKVLLSVADAKREILEMPVVEEKNEEETAQESLDEGEVTE